MSDKHTGQNAQDEKTVALETGQRAQEAPDGEDMEDLNEEELQEWKLDYGIEDIRTHWGEEVTQIKVEGQWISIRPAECVQFKHIDKDHRKPVFRIEIPALVAIQVDADIKSLVVETNGCILYEGKYTKRMKKILKENYPKNAEDIRIVKLEEKILEEEEDDYIDQFWFGYGRFRGV